MEVRSAVFHSHCPPVLDDIDQLRNSIADMYGGRKESIVQRSVVILNSITLEVHGTSMLKSVSSINYFERRI